MNTKPCGEKDAAKNYHGDKGGWQSLVHAERSTTPAGIERSTSVLLPRWGVPHPSPRYYDTFVRTIPRGCVQVHTSGFWWGRTHVGYNNALYGDVFAFEHEILVLEAANFVVGAQGGQGRRHEMDGSRAQLEERSYVVTKKFGSNLHYFPSTRDISRNIELARYLPLTL